MKTAADRFDAATTPQVEAADPRSASWVSANAGSGKTRVLTNRVARLLLSGTPPQRILCLTFTNAAASNMQIRLFEHLGAWAMLPDQPLRKKLLDLGEDENRLDDATLNRARTLFARALEAPGGLKIQTIHAFSSALLKRFPLEAGVSPQFKSIDDREARRLRIDILNELADADRQTYEAVVREVDAAKLPEFIEEIAAKRRHFYPRPSNAHIHQLFECVAGETAAAGEIAASLLESRDIEMPAVPRMTGRQRKKFGDSIRPSQMKRRFGSWRAYFCSDTGHASPSPRNRRFPQRGQERTFRQICWRGWTITNSG